MVHTEIVEVGHPPTDYCYLSNDSLLTDEWFSYDARGELTDVYEYTPHSGGYYHSTASYWANGALASLSGIPGYTALTYGVDGEGRVTTAQQGSTKIVCDSSCSSASTTFDPAGRPLVVKIGGTSDNDTYTYYPNTERMKTYTFTVGSTPKSIAGTLTWNQNGSLGSLAITDGFNSGGTETCNFGTSTVMGYDDLGRLLSANCGTPWTQTFTYDQFGNISKTGSLTWACTACYNGNNQYNNVLSSSISYDANGNLLNDTFHTYSWDVYGHALAIDSTTCGTNGTCLTYDALGRMVEKSVNSVYTEVLYSPVGKTAIMSGQTTSSAYFPLPAGETLYETGSTGSTQYFWHKDWLGSVRFASTIGGRASYFDRAFAPFGETYSNFGNTSGSNFTGDTQDTVSGTYDTPNRELNPNQGRWISPDPAGLGAVDVSNPQTFNRYGYVTNNPLSFIDPLGLKRPLPCQDGGASCYLGGPGSNCSLDGVDTSCAVVNAILLTGGSDGGTICNAGQCVSVNITPVLGGGNQIWIPGGCVSATDSSGQGTSGCVSGQFVSFADFGAANNWGPLYPPSMFTRGNNMPIVSQWRPPTPPTPYKPSVTDCMTGPNDAVDRMTENAPPIEHDPSAGGVVWQPGNRGSYPVTSPEATEGANALTVLFAGFLNWVGCMANAF